MKKIILILAVILLFTGCEAKEEEEPVIIEPVIVEAEEPPLYYDIPLSHEVQDYLRLLCEKREIPIELALAIMTVENRQFDPAVISSTNDYGLFQINICNHAYITTQIGEVDFLSICGNINAGTYWISRYYPRYTDIEKVALCYNLGEGNIKGVKSSEYSRKVKEAYEWFVHASSVKTEQ